MYSKHHTKAIVLGAYNVGEASRTYRLFTSDMGVVFARCQSSREVRSRHRYGLQFSSVSDISLVRSRDGWRITNVTPISSIVTSHKDAQKRMLAVRVLHLIRRLVVDEEQGSTVFDLVWNGLSALEENDIPSEHIHSFEILFVLRILHELGYVQSDPVYMEYVARPYYFSAEHISSFVPIHRKALVEINRALEASHL